MKKTKDNISGMFNSIAKRYDLLNHLLSANLDKRWRKIAIKKIKCSDSTDILDIATGTGDMALEIANYKPKSIVGIDIAENMIDIAKEKARKYNKDALIQFQIANAEDIPFADNSFDYVTVAFGVRNFEDLSKGLKEINRVIKPDGRTVILEFSKPENAIFKHLYYFYFKRILPLIGKLISNNSIAYNYLPESVKSFPNGNDFLSIMKDAGFTGLEQQKLTFGIASIYCGRKMK